MERPSSSSSSRSAQYTSTISPVSSSSRFKARSRANCCFADGRRRWSAHPSPGATAVGAGVVGRLGERRLRARQLQPLEGRPRRPFDDLRLIVLDWHLRLDTGAQANSDQAAALGLHLNVAGLVLARPVIIQIRVGGPQRLARHGFTGASLVIGSSSSVGGSSGPRFRRRSTSGRPSRSARRNTMSPRPRTWIPNTGARRRKTKRKGPSSPRPRRITIPIVPIAPISIPTSLVSVQDLRSYSWTLPPRGGPHKFPLTLDGAPASTRDAAPTPSTLLSKRAGRCVKTASSCTYR